MGTEPVELGWGWGLKGSRGGRLPAAPSEQNCAQHTVADQGGATSAAHCPPVMNSSPTLISTVAMRSKVVGMRISEYSRSVNLGASMAAASVAAAASSSSPSEELAEDAPLPSSDSLRLEVEGGRKRRA